MRRSDGQRARGLLFACLVVVAASYAGGASSAPVAAAQGSLVVSVSGDGRVESSPAGIDCGSACTAAFPLDTTVTLDAQPDAGSHFAAWHGGCEGSVPRCETTVDESTTVQAVFEPGDVADTPPAPPLRVTRAGNGAITSSPDGVIDCGTNCWTSFSGGGSVTLTATPGSDSEFEGWAGSCSGTGTCVVTMTAPRAATAIFHPRSIPAGSSTLTIKNRDPPSDPSLGESGTGTVRVTWPGNTATCEVGECDFSIPNGARVTVEPLPSAFTELAAYDGACVGTAPPCVVYLRADATVAVSFQNEGALSNTNGLNLTHSRGGRVESNPPGIACGSDAGCRAAFKEGLLVRLSETATAGYQFTGWRGDCSGTGSCSVSMTVPRSVSADFRPLRDQLRIVKTGRGTGTVTSEPAAIACGSDCSYSFRGESTVTLRAVADSGAHFGGWSGPCTGTGACRLTLHAPTDVTARFDRCAAAEFTGFTVSTRRSPRRVVARVALADTAAGRLRLLRRGRTLASKRFPGLVAGTNVLQLSVPRGVSGSVRVELRIGDVCGGLRSLGRTVTLPR